MAAKKIVRRGWNLSKSDAGSIIRFIYREYKNDMARPAFTQNLVYDLDQGSRVVFQSVELDVVDATNTEVRYKLLSGFPNYE